MSNHFIQIKIYLLIWTTLGVCLQQSENHYIKQPTPASLNFLLQPKKCTHFPFCSHSQIMNLVIIESQHTYLFSPSHQIKSNFKCSNLFIISFFCYFYSCYFCLSNPFRSINTIKSLFFTGAIITSSLYNYYFCHLVHSRCHPHLKQQK